MALLTPVPTYVGRLMASVQKEKMKKVGPVQHCLLLLSLMCDRRINVFKPSPKVRQQLTLRPPPSHFHSCSLGMDVIRMLKLFAWEAYMLAEIAQHRLEELKHLRKGKLLEVVMNSVNASLPLIAKVMTFTIYVRWLFKVQWMSNWLYFTGTCDQGGSVWWVIAYGYILSNHLTNFLRDKLPACSLR